MGEGIHQHIRYVHVIIILAEVVWEEVYISIYVMYM